VNGSVLGLCSALLRATLSIAGPAEKAAAHGKRCELCWARDRNAKVGIGEKDWNWRIREDKVERRFLLLAPKALADKKHLGAVMLADVHARRARQAQWAPHTQHAQQTT